MTLSARPIKPLALSLALLLVLIVGHLIASTSAKTEQKDLMETVPIILYQ